MIIIAYSLKVALLIAAFYILYKYCLSRETFYRCNRVVLLGSIVASFVLPLCKISFENGAEVVYYTINQPVIMLEEIIVGKDSSVFAALDWRNVAIAIYICGIAFCLVRIIISIVRVMQIMRTGERSTLPDGSQLIVIDSKQAPFSWFGHVVISRADLEEGGDEIITHEMAHIHKRHSIDLLLCDLLCCAQWFNPAMWLMRREVSALHEYEADKTVLDSGINAKKYQILLIKKAAGGKWYSIANSFNHSKLKYRITMMLRKKSSGWALAKVLYALPIVAIALLAFAQYSCSEIDDEDTKNVDTDKPLSEIKTAKVISTGKTPEQIFEIMSEILGGKLPEDGLLLFDENIMEGTMTVSHMDQDGNVRELSEEELEKIKLPKTKEVQPLQDKEISEDEIFIRVEEMPTFPGGEDALRSYLVDNFHYPKGENVYGQVFIHFIVDKSGYVKDVELARSTGFESIDEEALRVVKSMPQWNPGKQRGVNVNVSYVVPITFAP